MTPRPDDASAAGVTGAPAGVASVPASVITSQAAGQAAGENFPVALRMLPRRYRQHLAAVYGFARSADDMGDKAPVADRLGLLDELEADLARLYRRGPGADGPRLAVVQALAPAVAECAIPEQPFLDLIQANRQDQAVTRYRTFDDLLGYCRCRPTRSAGSCCTCSAATPRRAELSDSGLHRAAAGRALAGRGRGPAVGAHLPARPRTWTASAAPRRTCRGQPRRPRCGS